MSEPQLTRRELRELERAREAALEAGEAPPAAPQPSAPQQQPMQVAPPEPQAPVESPAAPPVASWPPAPQAAPAPEAPASPSPAPQAPAADVPSWPPPAGQAAPASARPSTPPWSATPPSGPPPSPFGRPMQADPWQADGRQGQPMRVEPSVAPPTADPVVATRPIDEPAPEAAASPEQPFVDEQSPHTGVAFVRPPAEEPQDADDYFHRLVVASHGGDAPTGMIVMPETFSPDLTGALNRTGDVMLTGSLRVSHELSSYGGYRDGLDQPDVDVELITENVRDGHGPVPARQAVSAQRSTGINVTPTHERGIKVWMGVLIGALVLAIAGAGVLVFGFMNGWF